MAIIYLVRKPDSSNKRGVLLASVQSTLEEDSGGKHSVDLFGELETIVDRYLAELEGS